MILDVVDQVTWPQPDPVVRQLCGMLVNQPSNMERVDLDQLERDLTAEYEDLEERRCELSAFYWLTRHTKTENKHHEAQGVPFKAPLPTKSYLRVLFRFLAECKRIFIPKSREMITSLSVMGYGAHAAQWRRAEVVVQCDSEDKAAELVNHATVNYDEQPAWLKKLHPLKTRNELELAYKEGGRVIGLPSGEHKIRLYHPTIYVMDEVSFLAGAEGCFNYASPVAQQIIGISSAGPGWFGNQCTRPA